MIITLLRSFAHIGFKFKIENGEVTATDNNGNELKEEIDYNVREKEKPSPIQIIQSNGLVTYSPPK